MRQSEDDEATFLADLRMLRDRAAIDYDELAGRAHYPADVLKEAESGPELPSLPVTAAFVTACGGDAVEWEERWRRLARVPAGTLDLPSRPPGASAAAAAGARAGVSATPTEVYDADRIRAALRSTPNSSEASDRAPDGGTPDGRTGPDGAEASRVGGDRAGGDRAGGDRADEGAGSPFAQAVWGTESQGGAAGTVGVAGAAAKATGSRFGASNEYDATASWRDETAAPERAASERVVSEHAASEHAASERAASERAASERAASEHAASVGSGGSRHAGTRRSGTALAGRPAARQAPGLSAARKVAAVPSKVLITGIMAVIAVIVILITF